MSAFSRLLPAAFLAGNIGALVLFATTQKRHRIKLLFEKSLNRLLFVFFFIGA